MCNLIVNNLIVDGCQTDKIATNTLLLRKISIPIITRLYTPADLGVLAVYAALLAIVGIGAMLKYDGALVLPQKKDDAINIFCLCLLLLLITTALFATALFFGSELLAGYYDGFDVVKPYLWFLLVGFIGMGLYTILNYWAIRQRDYKRITYTKINQGLGGSITKILLGLLAFGPMGLIIGHIISQIAGIGTLAKVMWRKERENLKSISLSGIKQVTRTYKSFPKFNFPASIINTMALQLPPLMLLAIYDARVAGLYALAHTVVVLPGSVISQSMGQAYLGEASKMVREKSRELRSLYVRTLKHLTVIAIPLIGIPCLLAPLIIPIIFGEIWVDAGHYCLPLALTVIPAFVVSPTTKLSLYGYNHWMLIWDLSRVFSVIGGFYIAYYVGLQPLYTITLYSIIMSLLYLINVKLNLQAIKNFIK